MSYAKNTSAPVIKVSDNNYYCVEAGRVVQGSDAAGAVARRRFGAGQRSTTSRQVRRFTT